jgi:hypothetical protein
MTPADIIQPAIRVARKQHKCDDCGAVIGPGTAYELRVIPPHRLPEYDVDRWLTWRTHWPRHDGQSFLPGCANDGAGWGGGT